MNRGMTTSSQSVFAAGQSFLAKIHLQNAKSRAGAPSRQPGFAKGCPEKNLLSQNRYSMWLVKPVNAIVRSTWLKLLVCRAAIKSCVATVLNQKAV